MAYHIKNAKGLFHTVHEQEIITVDVFRAFKAYVKKETDSDQKKQLEEIVADLESLKTARQYASLCSLDKKYKPEPKSWAKERGGYPYYFHEEANCIVFMALSNPQNNSPLEGIKIGSAEEAGWLALERILSKRKLFEETLKKLDASLMIPKSVPSYAVTKKRNSEIQFVELNKTASFFEASSVALFIHNAGFFDAKGSIGPLARARLFESAAAAKRTAGAHGLKEWKAVKVSLEMTGLEVIAGDSPMPELGGAIALQEARSLTKALEQANIDQLKEALAKLESERASTSGKAVAEEKEPMRARRL